MQNQNGGCILTTEDRRLDLLVAYASYI